MSSSKAHRRSSNFSTARLVLRNSGSFQLVKLRIAISAETQEVLEGIAPGALRGTVIRPISVTVAAFDRRGYPITVSGSDFLAATICHEIDHLDGILFMDKAKVEKR